MRVSGWVAGFPIAKLKSIVHLDEPMHLHHTHINVTFCRTCFLQSAVIHKAPLRRFTQNICFAA